MDDFEQRICYLLEKTYSQDSNDPLVSEQELLALSEESSFAETLSKIALTQKNDSIRMSALLAIKRFIRMYKKSRTLE